MLSNKLKQALKCRAEKYAAADDAITTVGSHKSAIIFEKIEDNFFPDSYKATKANRAWNERLAKSHQQVKDVCEMQSSNSSDALLMSIFCHPKINAWTGVKKKIFGVDQLHPEFGIKPRVRKSNGKEDSTEIDLAFGDIYAEAKLTETDFTEKEQSVVDEYAGLSDLFHVDSLPKRNGKYLHYQMIRNLLAASQHNKRHFLICDGRRGDLVRSYYEIVSCIKCVAGRKRCGVVLWQEIAGNVGGGLKGFLGEKYGLA